MGINLLITLLYMKLSFLILIGFAVLKIS